MSARPLRAAAAWLLLAAAALAQVVLERAPAAVAVEGFGLTESDLDESVAFFTRVLDFELEATGELAGDEAERALGVFGLRFSGFAAWWLWRTIYLAKLPRLEKKLRVMLDWTLDVVFSKDLVQFLGEAAPATRTADAAPAAAEGLALERSAP